ILSLRQAGHLISRVIRISLFYQNPTCFFSAYFLKHHRILQQLTFSVLKADALRMSKAAIHH
ncbi:hypothetical protein, partial [Acinetobacter sp. USHLN143]|uniref:hypothetical protein n=1 Tax=Acinetobacter sp. USHLN143 TaxID=3081679 RepID=UPI0030185474